MPFVFRKALESYPFPSLLSDTIRASLVTLSAGWTPAPADPNSVGQLPAGTLVLSSAPLSGKSFANGIFSAEDLQFAQAVPSGVQIHGILIWHDSGNPNTSRPLAWLDHFQGLPFTGDGQRRITLRWSPQGIFAPGWSS